MLGRGDRAYRYYRALLPSAMNDRAELRTIEPYVYGQFVVGASDPAHGTAHNPWLTGTASWAYVAATQWILGLRASLDGLLIDPCIPAGWEDFRATRVFRGATYEVTVKNPRRLCRGVRRLRVDGRDVVGNLVPPAPAGRTVRVEAEL
jgi:cellobiose phosphorylase